MRLNRDNKGEHKLPFDTLEEGKEFIRKNFKLSAVQEAIYKLQDNFKLYRRYFITLDELEAA